MASAMELLGRSFAPGHAAAAPRRGGGPCFAAVGREGSGAHRRRSSSSSSLRSTAPVDALAERVVAPPERAEAVPPEPSVAARAVVTVRRSRKRDAKCRVAERLDACADWVGRSVLLELISTETDPSKKKDLRGSVSTVPAAAVPHRARAVAWNSNAHPALRCIFELY
jgi:lipoxygenase